MNWREIFLDNVHHSEPLRCLRLPQVLHLLPEAELQGVHAEFQNTDLVLTSVTWLRTPSISTSPIPELRENTKALLTRSLSSPICLFAVRTLILTKVYWVIT